jgi:glycosyltransferase involved in cell wall biosynthesis
MSHVKADTQLNRVGGFSEPSLRNELEHTLGWSRVRELGVLDREGVRKIYERSWAGLVTLHPISNYLDALPIKMFEYMSAGIPVIASDFPLWREIIVTANCGVCVAPLDSKAIAGAINQLVTDPERAKLMGLNGRQAVERYFNWKTEEAKLVAFYERVLSSKYKNLSLESVS